MAPSAVETTATEAKPAQSYKIHLGPYKEIDTTRVDRDSEEGRGDHKAAKVSYVSGIYL